MSSLAAPRQDSSYFGDEPQRSTLHRLPVFALTGPVLGYAVRVVVDLPWQDPQKVEAAMQAAYMNLDIPNLVADRYCFLPATPAILDGFLPVTGAPAHMVIELSRAFASEPGADQRAASLRKMGVQLALEDYTAEPAQDALLPYVSFVVIDPDAPEDVLASIVRHAHAHSTRVIARDVQEQRVEDRCRRAEVDAVRGSYPGTREEDRRAPAPRVLRAGEMQCLAIMDMLNQSDIDFAGAAQIIDTDPVLTLRVLHLVNSGAFGVRNAVDTVHQAIVMLGPAETMTLATSLLVDSRPDAMDSLWFILARALACEALTDSPVGYTVGLLSALSAQLGVPDQVILEAVAVSQTAESAIRSGAGPLGGALAAVRAHERGDHNGVLVLGYQPEDVSHIYVQAVSDALATARAVSIDDAA